MGKAVIKFKKQFDSLIINECILRKNAFFRNEYICSEDPPKKNNTKNILGMNAFIPEKK